MTSSKKIFQIIIILILGFILNANLIYSQLLPGGIDEDIIEKEPSDNNKISVAIDIKTPNMLDTWGIELGARIILPIYSNFSLGLGFYELFTHNFIINTGDDSIQKHLRLGYFGLDLEYTAINMKPFRLSFSALLAFAHISYGYRSDIDIAGDIAGDWIGLFEPSLNIYYDFSKNYFFGVGLGYRKSLGVNLLNLSDQSLSGMVLSLIIGIKL